MSLIREIREALATAVADINGLRTSPVVPDQINPPLAVIYRKGIDYDLVYARGADTYTFGIQIFMSRVSERTSQDFLDEYCLPSGPNSVKEAVERDSTLGQTVDYVRVRSVTETAIVLVANVEYLSVEFDCEVVV